MDSSTTTPHHRHHHHGLTRRTSPKNDAKKGARSGPGGVTERTLTNGDTIKGLNRRVHVGHAPGGSNTRPGEIRSIDDCTRGGVLVGPDTVTSDASALVTAPKRSGDLHQQAKRAQQQRWQEASVATGDEAGGSAETGSVDNAVLRERLEVTLPVATVARGSTTSIDGRQSIESYRNIGEKGEDDDRSGKGRSGVRMLPSLRYRGSRNVSQADVGLDEQSGQNGSGSVSLGRNNSAIGNGREAVVRESGTTHTPRDETQVRERLLYGAGPSECVSRVSFV